jgi:putative nucleotidyltransferase with HDIG domain
VRNHAALQAHSRRVAAVACEIAERLKIGEREVLEQAALLHHYPPEVLDPGTLDRLIEDVRGSAAPLHSGFSVLSPPNDRVRAVLTSLRDRRNRTVNEDARLLAEIVELADFFTERLEFLPYEFETVEQVIDELDWMARDGFYQPRIVAALDSIPRLRKSELAAAVFKLPVYPAIALEALEIVKSEDGSFAELERLVKSDQVLAGQVLKAANAAYYSPSRPISSIPQAISYIGAEACRKVLMAAAFQPLFLSAHLPGLWRHSLVMADLAENIASACQGTEPAEAFLAGLVHDVGRLAFSQLSPPDVAVHSRLLANGCEPVFAELILAGIEHGAVGAEILRSWCFPAHLIEAVENHHRPELSESAMAALLYAAEHVTDAAEDFVSALRLRVVRERLGVPIEALDQLQGRPGVIDVLAANF